MSGAKRDCRCRRANHQHGTASAYQQDRCRCFPCRLANCQRVQAHRDGLTWIDAGSSWHRCTVIRRLEALHTLGWSAQALGARLGTSRDAVNNLRCWPSPQVYAGTARSIIDLYEDLWDQRPPERTQGERISASRTRNWARRMGFAPPLAWDDDSIDDPAAQPCAPGGLVLYIERNRMHIRKAPLDEVEVERFVSGHHAPLTGYAKSPEVIEAVRRLAARCLSDAQIGDRVGISGAAVLKIRERHGIPAGVEPAYRVRRRTATGTEKGAA